MENPLLWREKSRQRANKTGWVIEEMISNMKKHKSSLAGYGACIAIFLLLILFVPGFGTSDNVFNVIKQSAYIAIPAVGLTMVMIQGGIDLSVGGVMSAAGLINGALIMRGVPVGVGFIVTVLACMVLGFCNGIVVSRIKVPPFIATYTVGEIASGIALILGNGKAIGPFKNETYSYIGNGMIFHVPIPDILIVVVAIIGTIILAHTAFGNRIYAVGNNPMVVSQEGLSVANIKMWTYVISSICAAISGFLLSARMSSASPVQGDGYQLKCIASCVIGGVAMTGGSGKVFHSVIGAFFIATLSNVLNILAIDPFLQNLILGIVIITVVAVSIAINRRADELRKAY